MLDINFVPFPLLTTERLTLRRITNADADDLFFLRSDDLVMKYIDRPRPKSMEDIMQLIEKINKMIDANEGVAWAIALKNEARLIGHISFHVLMKEHHRAEIGYMLHPGHHGEGIMPEAVAAVLDYGFKTMGLHSVEAHVNPGNAASIKLLGRCNFTRDAYFKENYFWEGKFLDTLIFSKLAPGE